MAAQAQEFVKARARSYFERTSDAARCASWIASSTHGARACVLVLVALLGACGSHSGATRDASATIEITVYADVSLRDALRAIVALHAREDVATIALEFGSSEELARRIVASKSADVFITADSTAMDALAAAQLVDAGSRRELVSNALVVIESADVSPSRFHASFDASELASVERVALADVETNALGRHARDWLVRRHVWDAIAPKILTVADARAVVAAVESGAASAGIVARTDAASSQQVRTVFVVPSSDGASLVSTLAVIADRPHAEAAREWAAFLESDVAREVFESFGFTVIEAPRTPAAK